MKRLRQFFLLFVLLGFVVAAAQAQTPPWSGVISPARATNWQNAGAPGGIPSASWTQCGPTIAAYGSSGTPASPSTIQTAINSCGADQYVQLGAGSFYLSGSFYVKGQSNVEIRGMGANSTFIYFYGSAGVGGDNCSGLYSVICFEGSYNSNVTPQNGPVNWTAGYSQGVTVITLASVSNLKIGNTIILDELKSVTDNGAILEQDATTSTNPYTSPGSPGPYSYAGGQVRAGRGLTHVYTVIGCDGSTTIGHTCTSTNITIDPPLEESYWDSTLSPQAWWATAPIRDVGVQNLAIDGTNNGCSVGNSPLIGFFNAVDGWVRGVRSFNGCEAHVRVHLSARVTVRDSYFMLARDSTSTSYGVECFASNDSLVENNIFQAIAGPVIIQEGCSGWVTGYNFAINDYYSVAGYGLAMSQTHGIGADLDLWEGNIGAALEADVAHGSHMFNTAFRNRLMGVNTVCWQSGPTNGDYASYLAATWGSCPNAIRGIEFGSFSRFDNALGNVLGTTGVTLNYQVDPSPVFRLGQGQNTVGSDPTVAQTFYRWGNCDNTNGGSGGTPFTACQFNSSEVPTTGTLATSQQPWAQTVPSSHTLPASFYYSSKPFWWPSSKPWPIIGPDVTGGNISGVNGLAYTNPAEDCYKSLTGTTANGAGGPFPFDADTCYGSEATSGGTPPAAPTNLSATVD